ncbi:metal-dependent transcriptional regulator [Syntrophotalea acetylenica]|uniref:Transcriptional regulator n=1 Tax=Syntrophotalea acetylenica TaxID=29542 RepID=A0A1L3GJG3_SYNAC|nr:metal-dependent transcriptional regulator [Syntrophotalea acetylenica]APG26076.1 transcriptional regulator [Syntrophotalea acetylenica]APG44142.1 transcriptional regulator [Syntrophotalea acetylenica]
MERSERAEDLLEAVWIAVVEEGDNSASFEALNVKADDAALLDLERKALVEIKGERVYLRSEGRLAGEKVVRRHRLAERLMMDILDLKGSNANAKACEFEHLLNEGVDTRICTLLNHPTTCPHGRPIPPGECCRAARRAADIGVVPLTEMKVGQEGEIAYLATSDAKKMQKLMSLGVLPGNRVRLNRRFPSFIFHVGNSEFAVDEQLAREIFIRTGKSE